MSGTKASAKRASRGKEEADPLRSEKKKVKQEAKDSDQDDQHFSSDVKEIISALQQFREKTLKDEQKKNEETIGSVATEIRTMIDDAKTKIEKERQSLLKILFKSSKECESLLKNEYAKFQADYEKFCKEKAAHVQTFKDIFSKFEDEMKKLSTRCEQQRKKEKLSLSELEKACADKMANAEESLKKTKLDNKTISFLRKSVSSFLEGASDDDFEPDE